MYYAMDKGEDTVEERITRIYPRRAFFALLLQSGFHDLPEVDMYLYRW